MDIPPSVKPSRISLAKFHPINDVLHQAFMIKDLDLFKYFLGLEVVHSKQSISPCQRKNSLDLFVDSCLLGSKHVTIPSNLFIKLCHDNNALFEDIPSYKRLIGKLIYLNTIRPYITFTT